ncbi:hypothetical protein QBC37DRAFT_430026 [Rhypophila decipiens]|uniref:Protein kinase domain-containing protein n=1 Tax=Rhypophila decipiens TaxID=261697 RepID=A0AAN7B4G3_9PEZI|nr:hypothetical protein QBC37DRAFT_430026 [Rhypophila decipiens]
MEATVVIEILRDTYALVEFVQQTAHTIRHHEDERDDLDLKFEFQSLRLKQYYDRFTAKNEDATASGSTGTFKLQDIPKKNLELVHRCLTKLQKILAEYKDAAYKDQEYRQQTISGTDRHFQAVQQSPGSNSGISHATPSDGDTTSNAPKDLQPGTERSDHKTTKSSGWGWNLFGRRRGKTVKRVSRTKDKVVKGIDWLFEKDKLESLLVAFTAWNDELERNIPYILSGTSESLGLWEDGNSIFGVHVRLQQVSRRLENAPEGHWAPPEEQPMPWEKAETEMKAPRVLLEYKVGPSDKMVYAQQLAWLLRATGNHKFNTLPFIGFAPDPGQPRYVFLFDYPRASTADKPTSLQQVILSNKPVFRMSLKDRFHVARTIAASIGAFHADGWFHKSIRSHAIKFFFKPDGSCDFRNPCLTEFESSRPEGGQSLLLTTATKEQTINQSGTVKDPERDVYLHPDRALDPPKPFTRIYDIFSLGVVLLEIGLWQTAKGIYDEVLPQIPGGTGNVTAKAMQAAFLQQAKTRLEHRMGTTYREAVEDCLGGSMEKYIGSPGFSIEYRNRIVSKVDIEKLMESD